MASVPKSARSLIWFVLLGGAALWLTLDQRLALCSDWRYAILRELERAEGPSPDVLFLGSSRTARGVIPSVFEEEVARANGEQVRALNVAIMGTPRHVALLQLQDWLEEHDPPEAIFVEMGTAGLMEWPHKTLTRFLGPVEALRMLARQPYDYTSQAEYGRKRGRPPIFDPGGLVRALGRNALHLQLALNALGRGPEDVLRVGYNALRNLAAGRGLDLYWADEPRIDPEQTRTEVNAQGWHRLDRGNPSARAANDRFLEAERAHPTPIAERIAQVRAEDFSDPGRFRATRLYADRLANLCRERGIRLIFMELSAFAEPGLSPSHVAVHEARGEVFRPDPAELQRLEYYLDPGHLSRPGAELYTRRLARFFARR